MRILVGIVLALFLVEGILARPETFLDDFFSGLSNTAKEDGNRFNGSVTNTGKFFNDAVQSGVDRYGEGIQQGSEFFKKTVEKSSNFFSNASQKVKKATEKACGYVGRRWNRCNRWVKRMYAKVTEQIVESSQNVQEAINDISKEYRSALERVQGGLQNTKREIQNWASQIQEELNKNTRISKEDKEKIEALLKNYVEQSNEKLFSCALESLKPVEKAYQKAKQSLNKATCVIQDVSDGICSCGDNHYYSRYRLQRCLQAEARRLPSVDRLVSEVESVTHELEELDNGEKSCLGSTLEGIDSRRDEVEKEIGAILEKYKQQPTTVSIPEVQQPTITTIPEAQQSTPTPVPEVQPTIKPQPEDQPPAGTLTTKQQPTEEQLTEKPITFPENSESLDTETGPEYDIDIRNKFPTVASV